MTINPKSIFIIFALLGLYMFIACTQQKNKNSEKQTAKGYQEAILSKCIKPDIQKLIARVDTISAMPFKTRCFDAKRRIVCELETNSPYQNNTNYWYTREKVYDTLGRIVYESYSYGAFPTSHLECYNYTYDLRGILITKEGYEAAETNSYVSIQYKNGAEIKRAESKLDSMPAR